MSLWTNFIKMSQLNTQISTMEITPDEKRTGKSWKNKKTC